MKLARWTRVSPIVFSKVFIFEDRMAFNQVLGDFDNSIFREYQASMSER